MTQHERCGNSCQVDVPPPPHQSSRIDYRGLCLLLHLGSQTRSPNPARKAPSEPQAPGQPHAENEPTAGLKRCFLGAGNSGGTPGLSTSSKPCISRMGNRVAEGKCSARDQRVADGREGLKSICYGSGSPCHSCQPTSKCLRPSPKPTLLSLHRH